MIKDRSTLARRVESSSDPRRAKVMPTKTVETLMAQELVAPGPSAAVPA